MTTLDKSGLLEYGAVIPAGYVRETLGIVYPDVATKREFDSIALCELSAVDYVRNVLLGRGMYLTYNNGSYRILLPSENAKQVELYISSADKKLSRALKLSKNSPKLADHAGNTDQINTRIVMKQQSLRRNVPA